jgi:hypothetical protein
MKKSTKTILSLVLLCLLPLATNAQSNMKGDANADGVINATDVVEIISYIHGKPSPTFNKDNADLNKDGIVDERDVEELAKLILTSLVYPERKKVLVR